ncbi:MAG TPA: hypothetical protein VES20_16555 [Bryobacteraceae bacterium]|nr:hypothetical protein [Bryobacteraceae bacterium]
MPEENETPSPAAALRGDRALRFHMALHAANALASLAVLKIEGPFYADYLVAGWLVCSSIAALTSARMLTGFARRPLGLLIALSLFYLASAVTVFWLTWTGTVEHTHEEDAVARNWRTHAPVSRLSVKSRAQATAPTVSPEGTEVA